MSDQQSISDTSSDSPNASVVDKWDSIKSQIEEDENLSQGQKAVLYKFLAGAEALSTVQAARDIFRRLADVDKTLKEDVIFLRAESSLETAVFDVGVALRDKGMKWVAEECKPIVS